jgi:hypothetical protein
MKDLDVQ